MALLIDVDNMHIEFTSCKHVHPLALSKIDSMNAYYIGQIIHMQLRCKIAEDGLNKLRSPHPSRSPLSFNVLEHFKRQLCSAIYVECTVTGKNKCLIANEKTAFIHSDVIDCSYCKQCCTEEICKSEAFLSDDKLFYYIPLQVRIPDVCRGSRRAEIRLHVRLNSKQGPVWLSSPTKFEAPYSDDLQISPISGRIVSQIVRIIHPPELSALQKHAGNQEMIFLQVKNSSSYQLKVEECVILPESCPKSVPGSQLCMSSEKRRGACVVHGNLVRMIGSDTDVLPVVLRPRECVSLCYSLNLLQCEASFSKEDVALEARLKWNQDKKKFTNTTTVVTRYRLHSLKLKKGLFVVSAACENVPRKTGQCFTVTYTIHNRLQDFLSIRLYWSPVLTDCSDDSVRNFERLQARLICQDPIIQLGSCQYGDTIRAKVTFCAVSAGLYEVCKHMKINLRYLIPGSETNSLASPTSQSSAISDDHLGVVSNQLWRTRSGSSSSFNKPGSLTETSRMSAANKSYSFGDLGPNNIPDTELFNTPRSDKSPVLPRRDPMLNVTSAIKYEQMLLSPGNFIKNSCLVRVE